jgi:hypothetical protein
MALNQELHRHRDDLGSEDPQVTRDSVREKAETASHIVVKGYQSLGRLIEQHEELRSQFVKIAQEFRNEFLVVRDYFAHKPVKELFLGKYRTGEQWSKGEIGITYRHFCSCIPKMPAAKPLLPVRTEDVATATKEQSQKDTSSLDSIAASLTSLFAAGLVLPTKTPDRFTVTIRDLTKAEIERLAGVLETEPLPFEEGRSV